MSLGSVITVQVGQAGNQVGCELFDVAAAVYAPRTGARQPVLGGRRGAGAGPGRSSRCGGDGGGGGAVPGPGGVGPASAGCERLFRSQRSGGPDIARAVLVDMEKKVIGTAIEHAKRRVLRLF